VTAPIDDRANRFSNRIRAHQKVVEHWDPRDQTNPCIWMIDDELLFLESASPVAPTGSEPTERGANVQRFLQDLEIETTLVTTLFADLDHDADIEDVHLVRVTAHGQGHGVAVLTERLREGALADEPSAVSPNHVLIPASNGDGCPHGPPTEYTDTLPPPIPGTAEPNGTVSPSFTLIDSGYMWDGSWGVNPLDGLLGHPQPPAIPGLWPTNGGWQPTPAEEPDANHDKKLDALAGHANFAAGILARRTREPRITIWDHNASFVGKDAAHIPTELAVLHSLLASQEEQPTPVIVVIFAFPVFGGKLGGHWEHAWRHLQRLNPNFVLVAPTGNQSDTARRYPAALAIDHPDEVVGVASLDEAFNCSDFSNRGTDDDPWVTCSAVGEEVASTFLHVNMDPEDQPWPLGSPKKPHNFRKNDWAIWQGTSFAAPKVAAAIANQLDAAGGDARAAWGLVAREATQSGNDVGLVLDQL
jgi:hypothetical protein